jgi:K+-sensing histidine kinase KdpD
MLKGTSSPLLRYGVAVIAVALALLLTRLLWPLLDRTVFSLFFAAVMVSAWYGGRGPGLLATAVAVLVIDIFFFHSVGTFVLDLQSLLRLTVFVMVALLISSLTAARKRAEGALRKAHDELELRVQERTMELAQANEASRAEIAQRKRAEEEKQQLLHDLGERVKELTVLHGIARQLQNEQKPTAELLQEIAALLPSAWQYPELTAARIVCDNVVYATPNFSPTLWIQQAAFTTPGGKLGVVEIAYLEEKPNAVEGPFLTEERSLLDSVAELLQLYRESEEAKAQIAQVTQELVRRNTVRSCCRSSRLK